MSRQPTDKPILMLTLHASRSSCSKGPPRSAGEGQVVGGVVPDAEAGHGTSALEFTFIAACIKPAEFDRGSLRTCQWLWPSHQRTYRVLDRGISILGYVPDVL